MPVFAGSELTCLRGDRLVFTGLDFSIAPGEALVLLGPNGSGKSSLLRVMAGLLRPFRGRLSWDGVPVADDPDGHRARVHYVGHLDAVKPVLSAVENLSFWARLGGAADPRASALAALERLGVPHIANVPGRYLSAGQKRRLNLARVLAAPARLWLLDEPTVALDRAAIMRRDDIQAFATGNARLTHGPEGGLIAGKLRIMQARLKMGGTTAANPVPRIEYEEVGIRAAEQPVSRPPRIQPFRLDLELSAPDEVMLEGIGLHSEWRGALAVRGTTVAPALTGRLDLVRGTYEFSGRDFDLDRGQIILRGETPPDPILDIVASHTLDGITVNIEIKGTARRPEVVFNSTPRLPQEEVLSRLLFGASVPNLSATEAVQLGAALAALQGGNPDLNIIGRVGKAVGIDRLRVMPGDRRKGIGTTFSGGKYITDKVYLEVATDGRGYTATLVEIDLTRTLSLLSQIATLGSTDVSLKWSRDY